jgi:DNA-binding response OmpR family regulator
MRLLILAHPGCRPIIYTLQMIMRRLSGKILVIDDDPNVLQILDLMLSQAHHRVTTASNWDEGMEILKEVSEGSKPFDIIFLDLVMPGHTGFDVLRSLTMILYPMPPVVILTAMNDLENAIKALELGATKYLTKPIDADKMLQAVRDILGGVEGSRF